MEKIYFTMILIAFVYLLLIKRNVCSNIYHVLIKKEEDAIFIPNIIRDCFIEAKPIGKILASLVFIMYLPIMLVSTIIYLIISIFCNKGLDLVKGELGL